MLGAFFDDSGSDAASPIVAIGGLLGTDQQWDEFDTRWTKQLRQPAPGRPPLKQFHLSQCRAAEGEFATYKPVEREYVTGRFRDIILDVDLVTIACAVNKQAWDQIIVGDLAEATGSPLEACFYKCVESVVQTIRLRKPGEQAYIAFDRGIKDRLEPFAEYIMLHDSTYPEIERIGFLPVQPITALQGADLIATETFQYGKQWVVDRNGSKMNPLFSVFEQRELSSGMILDREHIEEIADRVRQTIRDHGAFANRRE